LEERFEILSKLVWGVHGDVQKLKTQIAGELGIKAAHDKVKARLTAHGPEIQDPFGVGAVSYEGGEQMLQRVHGEIVQIAPAVGAATAQIEGGGIPVHAGYVQPRQELGVIHGKALYGLHFISSDSKGGRLSGSGGVRPAFSRALI